jgi:predicted small lipoprotein YifL
LDSYWSPACYIQSFVLETFMIATLNKALYLSLLISLAGCGVRGPLYMTNVPPVPSAPTEPEPKGKLYPPQTPASPSNSSSAK